MTTTMEQYDLTSKVSPFLDRHMMFPLLEYLDTLIEAKTVSYSTKDVAAARLSLLRPTHMVDYAIDVYKGLEDGSVPQEMEDQKKRVYDELEELRKGCKALEDLCANQEERSKLTSAGKWNVVGLAGVGITTDMLDNYRDLGKFNYECGDYKAARNVLENYISFFAKPPAKTGDDDDDGLNPNAPSQQQDTDIGNSKIYYLESVTMELLPVLWGKLAAEILVEDWEAARVALVAVQTGLESLVAQKNQLTALQALQQRTWLLHWSLFVFWNNGGYLEHMVELMHSERYKQAITTNAPHLLRYLTAAVLLSKRVRTFESSRRLLKTLITVMQDCDTYTDPICEFVHALCVGFDFNAAQLKLAECKAVLDSDFFLCKQTDLFMEEARVFVFEHYCRIHNKIDLAELGDKLAMGPDDAERWIVNLIRTSTSLNATINDESHVVMDNSRLTQSVYEQVMEKTRDVNVRSATLAQNLQTVLKDSKKEAAKRERAAREEEY